MSITVIGCSSAPTVIPFEQEKLDITAQRAEDKCTWPELVEVRIDGQIMIAMTLEGLEQQSICQATEQTNHEVAEANADSVDFAIEAFNGLIDKAMLHNEYAQNELDREHDELKEERLESRTLKGLLAAVLIAVAL